MKIVLSSTLAASLLLSASAWAGPCTEEIAKLESAAKSTDAKNSPGSQETPKTSDGKPSEASAGTDGGGTKSASAKILEAKARDQRRDEPGCMEAVEEAKKLIGS